MPEWLVVDKGAESATVSAVPSRHQIDTEIQEQLIVELYSK